MDTFRILSVNLLFTGQICTLIIKEQWGRTF